MHCRVSFSHTQQKQAMYDKTEKDYLQDLRKHLAMKATADEATLNEVRYRHDAPPWSCSV